MRPGPLRSGGRPVGRPPAAAGPGAVGADGDRERFWPSRRPCAYDEFCR